MVGSHHAFRGGFGFRSNDSMIVCSVVCMFLNLSSVVECGIRLFCFSVTACLMVSRIVCFCFSYRWFDSVGCLFVGCILSMFWKVA